jgi:hypothetical protein
LVAQQSIIVHGQQLLNVNLYVLPFDAPMWSGRRRFFASSLFRLQDGRRSEEYPYQPIAFESEEIIDCRLSPKHPGLFVLRVFVIVSTGAVVQEHELIPALQAIVPDASVEV